MITTSIETVTDLQYPSWTSLDAETASLALLSAYPDVPWWSVICPGRCLVHHLTLRPMRLCTHRQHSGPPNGQARIYHKRNKCAGDGSISRAWIWSVAGKKRRVVLCSWGKILVGDGWDSPPITASRSVGSSNLDAHLESFLGRALVDAAGRRDIGIVAPRRDPDIFVRLLAVVGRIE